MLQQIGPDQFLEFVRMDDDGALRMIRKHSREAIQEARENFRVPLKLRGAMRMMFRSFGVNIEEQQARFCRLADLALAG